MPSPYENIQDSIVEFSMAVTKANIDENGAMRWRSVNSDIEKDYYGERMSKELFEDFLKHIKNNESIPDAFRGRICEDDWCGGMPYLSLAHYKSGKDKVNVPGEPQIIYLDGKALKSKGVLYDSPLGKSVFKSLQKDLVEKREDKVRVSIGFLDLEHKHGDVTFTRKAVEDKCDLCKEGKGDKIYTKGHLVHLALTRKPANPRTDFEVEKSMTTKLEDAKSIVEDEDVLKDLELKSQATEDVLVIKSDKAEEPVVEKVEAPVENTVVSQPVEAVATQKVEPQVAQAIPVIEDSPLEKSLATIKDRVAVIKSQGLTGDNALQELQSTVDELGNVLRSEFTPKPTPEQVANQNLEATLRSLLSEMLPAALAQTVAPIQSELSELRALSLVKPPVKREEAVPQPRSLNLVQKSAIEQISKKVEMSQFDRIARASVGLPS